MVGSILGGFGTLNPDNVLLMKDGTVKEKESKPADKGGDEKKKSKVDDGNIERQKEDEKLDKNEDSEKSGKRRHFSSSSSIKEIIMKNKKRRKITFAEGDSDEEMPSTSTTIYTSSSSNHGDNDKKIYQSYMRDEKKKLQLAEQKLRQGYLEKQKEKQKAEELKQQVQILLKEGKQAANHKSQASMFSVAKFKIPKKQPSVSTSADKDHNNPTSNRGNSEDTKKKRTADKTLHDSPSKKSAINQSIIENNSKSSPVNKVKQAETTKTCGKLDLSHRKDNPPLPKKQTLTLDKKIQLYNRGELHSKEEIPQTRQNKNGIPPTTQNSQSSQCFKTLKSSIHSNSCTKAEVKSILKVKPVSSCTSKDTKRAPPLSQNKSKYGQNKPNSDVTFASSSSSKENCLTQHTIKKPISLQDYKKRQFISELFGSDEVEKKCQKISACTLNDGKKKEERKSVKFEGVDVSNNHSTNSHLTLTTTHSLRELPPSSSGSSKFAISDITKCPDSLHPSTFASNLFEMKNELCEEPNLFSPQSENGGSVSSSPSTNDGLQNDYRNDIKSTFPNFSSTHNSEVNFLPGISNKRHPHNDEHRERGVDKTFQSLQQGKKNNGKSKNIDNGSKYAASSSPNTSSVETSTTLSTTHSLQPNKHHSKHTAKNTHFSRAITTARPSIGDQRDSTPAHRTSGDYPNNSVIQPSSDNPFRKLLPYSKNRSIDCNSRGQSVSTSSLTIPVGVVSPQVRNPVDSTGEKNSEEEKYGIDEEKPKSDNTKVCFVFRHVLNLHRDSFET